MRKPSYLAVIGALGLLILGCGAEPAGDEPQVEAVRSPLNMSKWSGWHPHPAGAVLFSAPAITSRGVNDLVMVAMGSDSRYYRTSWTPATYWNGWSAIGINTFLSKPSITAFPNPNGGTPLLIVAGLGADKKIWVNAQNTGGSFAGWVQVPGGTSFTSAPAIACAGSVLTIIANITAGTVMDTTLNVSGGFDNRYWDAWRAFPIAPMWGDPAAVAVNGIVTVAGMDISTGRYVQNRFNPQTNPPLWSNGQVVLPALTSPAHFVSSPAVSGWSGHLDVFGRGNNDYIRDSSSENSGATWGAFQQVPAGTLNSDPAVVSYAPGHIDMVARGYDNNIWIDTYQE